MTTIEQAREVSHSLRHGRIDDTAMLNGADTIDALIAELATLKAQQPVAHLAWRDGKPCWEGDDCVCADAVYPVDSDDDRTSMPLYLAAGAQEQRKTLTDEQIKDEFAKMYPRDIGILELAENNRDFAVEAIGARHHWAAFLSGARAIEAAHGIK